MRSLPIVTANMAASLSEEILPSYLIIKTVRIQKSR